jgi:hypothetical protein
MRSSRLSRSNYRNKYISFWYLDDEKCECGGGEKCKQTIENTVLRAS